MSKTQKSLTDQGTLLHSARVYISNPSTDALDGGRWSAVLQANGASVAGVSDFNHILIGPNSPFFEDVANIIRQHGRGTPSIIPQPPSSSPVPTTSGLVDHNLLHPGRSHMKAVTKPEGEPGSSSSPNPKANKRKMAGEVDEPEGSPVRKEARKEENPRKFRKLQKSRKGVGSAGPSIAKPYEDLEGTTSEMVSLPTAYSFMSVPKAEKIPKSADYTVRGKKVETALKANKRDSQGVEARMATDSKYGGRREKPDFEEYVIVPRVGETVDAPITDTKEERTTRSSSLKSRIENTVNATAQKLFTKKKSAPK